MALKRKHADASSPTNDSASSSPTGSASTDGSDPSSPTGSAASSPTGSASSSSPPEGFTSAEIKEAINFDPCYAIGEGSYGTVYKGELKRLKQVVAGKQVAANQEMHFVKEVAMHRRLNNENIIKLIGISSIDTDRLIILEYMSEGSLFDKLHNRKSDEMPITWITRLCIAVGVAEGLNYLHNLSAPVIHGDVKSANILLDKHLTPKLSDFGNAVFGPTETKSDSGIQMKIVEGTTGYLDPQFIKTKVLTTKCDVYSFGVVLLELITGRQAISEYDQNVVKMGKRHMEGKQ